MWPLELWLDAAGATESPTGVDYAALTQYGVLGIFAVILIVFARAAYARETARSDRLEAEVLRLNTTIQSNVIPALESATRAVQESTGLMQSMQREREFDQRTRVRDGGTP